MSIIVSLHSDPAFFYLLLIFQIYTLLLYILIPFVNVLAHMSTLTIYYPQATAITTPTPTISFHVLLLPKTIDVVALCFV